MDATHEWPWSCLFWGRSYKTTLTVENKCKTTETVKTYVNHDVASLLAMPNTIQAPPGKTNVDVTITIAPLPKILPPQIGWSPAHVDIKGFVGVGRDLFRVMDDDPCFGPTKKYTVTGHIHPDPDPPDKEQGNPCLAYWMTNRLPPHAVENCKETFREIALHYVSETLKIHIERAPEEWTWLPSAEQIQQMAADELLSMKLRAQRQIMGTPRAEGENGP